MTTTRTNRRPGPAVEVEPMVYRVRDVARALALSEGQVRRLMWAGTIPHIKVGGAVRVSANVLREYIDGLVAAGRKGGG